jgi:hypothetical protein
LGLSIAISGAIILSVMLLVFMTVPGLMEKFVSIGEISSKTSDLEDIILKTDTKVQELLAFSGSKVVNFDLLNEGNEKLWDYDKFNVIITYDAYTGGATPTRLTEHFTYNGTGAFDSSIVNGTADFRIQRGTTIIPNFVTTTTITEGVGNDFMMCQGDCFIKVVNSRNSAQGQTDQGQQSNHDDYTVYIPNIDGLTTKGDTITFERHDPGADAGGEDDRVTWEIWEYIGDAGGANEMTVLDSGVCTFAAGIATCNGAVILGGANDDNDVEVIVAAAANPDTSNNQVQRCMVTSSWNSGTDQPVFTRAETLGTNLCDVSYAVVEWTGSNWAVQRITHDFTSAATQTETITSVGDRSRAFFHTQQRNTNCGACDNADNIGSEVELVDPTTIEYRLPQGGGDWSGNMDAVTWVISNAETDNGERMIVNHYNPPERSDFGGGLPEEDNWRVKLAPALTYTFNGTAITGLSNQNSEGGNNYPQGYLNAKLTNSTYVDFWRSEETDEDEYTFQVTEFPRIFSCLSDNPGGNLDPTEWTINYIIDDPNECAAITVKLSNPIFSGGVLVITISTDNAIISTQSQIVP